VIYLFLELPFVTQLEQLPETSLQEWQGELEGAVAGRCELFRRTSTSTWVLSFPHVKASHTQVAVEGLRAAMAVMEDWKPRILVYHGIIVASEKLDQASKSFEDFRLLLPRQNHFWADSTSVELLGAEFSFVSRDRGLFQLDLAKGRPRPQEVLPEVTRISPAIDDWFWNNPDSVALFLAGQREYARDYARQLTQHSPTKIDGGTFYLWGEQTKEPTLDPLIRALRAWIDSGKLVGGSPSKIAPFFSPLSKEQDSISVEPEDFLSRVLETYFSDLVVEFSRAPVLIFVDGWAFFSERLREIMVRWLSLVTERTSTKIVVCLGSEPQEEFEREMRLLRVHSQVKLLSLHEVAEPFVERYSRLDESSRVLLEILSICDGMFNLDHLAHFAEIFGINKLLVPQMMKDLSHHGLVYTSDIVAATGKPIVRKSVQNTVADFTLSQWEAGSMVLLGAHIRLAFTEAEDWKALLRLGYLVSLIGNAELLEFIIRLLEARGYRDRETGDVYEVLARLLKGELQLLSNQIDEADRSSLALDQTPFHEDWESIDGYRCLLNSRISYSLHRWDTGVQEVKNSLVIFQKLEDQLGRFLGLMVYGEIIFAKNKLQDAKEYFQIATRQAEDLGLGWLVTLSRVYELLANCAHGFHSRSLNFFAGEEPLDQRLYRIGLTRWAYTARFYWGRILQLLGDYPQAQEVFSLDGLPTGSIELTKWEGTEPWKHLMSVWAARNRSFIDPVKGLQELEFCSQEYPEYAFFFAESAFLNQQTEKALQILTTPRAELPLDHVMVIWRPQPFGGYTLLEDHFIGNAVGFRVVDNLTSGFTGFLRAQVGQVQEGSQELFQLCRQRTLAQGDPFYHWYLSWYESVLQMLNNTVYEASVEDHSTVLGRAIKAMQERSAKIEDPAHRRIFLSLEMVNKQLIAKGRKHNLI